MAPGNPNPRDFHVEGIGFFVISGHKKMSILGKNSRMFPVKSLDPRKLLKIVDRIMLFDTQSEAKTAANDLKSFARKGSSESPGCVKKILGVRT